MNRMEIIRMRTSADMLEKCLQLVRDYLVQICDVQDLSGSLIMKHALHSGEIGAVLSWNGEEEPEKTHEGIVLAELLRRYGAVDHAVWEVIAATADCPPVLPV